MKSKIVRWKKAMDISRKITGCHQIPERSFFFCGYQFLICSRCTGIIVGYVVSLILFALKIIFPIWLCVILCMLMIIDGGIQLMFSIMSNNFRRFITGMLCGIGTIDLIINFIIAIIRIVI